MCEMFVLDMNIHNGPIGLLRRGFASRPEDRDSIPVRVTPKTQNMVLGISLLNIIRCVSRVKWSNPEKGVVAIKKAAFRTPLTTVANFTLFIDRITK